MSHRHSQIATKRADYFSGQPQTARKTTRESPSHFVYGRQTARKRAESPQSKKARSKITKEKKITKHKRKRNESYNIYIYKVLKQVHPEIGVSKQAMKVLNSFVGDLFARICTEAGNLCQYAKKHTLGEREVAAATSLILPGELGKHARSEGYKSVNKYMNSMK